MLARTGNKGAVDVGAGVAWRIYAQVKGVCLACGKGW
jgi:hypothetical protein